MRGSERQFAPYPSTGVPIIGDPIGEVVLKYISWSRVRIRVPTSFLCLAILCSRDSHLLISLPFVLLALHAFALFPADFWSFSTFLLRAKKKHTHMEVSRVASESYNSFINTRMSACLCYRRRGEEVKYRQLKSSLLVYQYTSITAPSGIATMACRFWSLAE